MSFTQLLRLIDAVRHLRPAVVAFLKEHTGLRDELVKIAREAGAA